MNSFRVVDTRFRILKGGKIGLAASIALIGGMLTLGSVNANAVTTDVGGGLHYWDSSETQSDSISVVSSQNSVGVSSSSTWTYYDYENESWYSTSGITYYDGTISVAAGQNLTGENINGTVYAVYSKDTTPNGYTTAVDFNGATLDLAGNNTISGLVGVNVNTDNSHGGVDALSTINIATGTVTFNNNVYADNIEINSGANVNFYGDISDDNGTSVIDYNGHNATVTLNDGSDLSGSIVKSSGSTNGTLILEGNSNISGNVGTTSTTGSSTIGLVTVRGENKTVSIGGDLSTDHLDYQAASTVTVNGDLILDVKTALNAVNQVTFDSHEGILNVGGDIRGVEGKDTITTTGNGIGTVTMLSGTQSITGNIGTSTNKIETLNIGSGDSDVYSNTTMNGDVFAITTSLNSDVYTYLGNTTNNSVLTMASGYDITSDIVTNENGFGILNLAGGTQTVDGQVGTTGMRLDQVNSGVTSATSTFKDSVFSDAITVATGTTTFESTVTVTDSLTSNGTLIVEGTTLVDGASGQIDINAGTATFESTVTVSGASSKVNVDGGTATFEDVVALNASLAQIDVNAGTVTFESNVTTNASNSLITIDGGTTTFDGTVTVGDSISTTGTDRDTLVTFNNTVTTNYGNISFTDSTIKMGNAESGIFGEDGYIAPNTITVNVGNDLLVNDADLSEVYANILVDNDVTVSNTANVDITGNLTLSGEDSILTINDSTFEITGSTLLNDEYKYSTIPSETSISIANSDATFNGIVTVSSAAGDLSISNGSDVTFNDTVSIGDSISVTGTSRDTLVTFNDNVTTTNGDISFTNSTIKMGNAESGTFGEDGYIAANSITVNVGNDLVVTDTNLEAYVTTISADNVTLQNDSDVEITGTVNVSNDMTVYNYTNANIIGNINVANDVNIDLYSTADITGDLTLSGEDSRLTITNSDFTITGATLLSSNDSYYSYTDIVMNNADATFDGTVTVLSEYGDISISNGSDVVFNGEMGEDSAVFVGGDMSITNSTVAFGTINGEDNTISALTNVVVGDDLTIDSSTVRFGSTVETGVDLNIYNSSTVTFEKAVTIGDDLDIENSIVVFNDTVDIEENLDIYNSTVTFEKAVTIMDNSEIYSYDTDTTVHFKDTVIANADITIGNSYYNDTTVTFDKDLTITTGEDSFGTLHLDDSDVVVNANGHINANAEFDDNAELNVADTKNIYGTVTTTSNGDGILNFLGTTTLFGDIGDIGEDSAMLSQVSFAATGEDAGSFTQNIGYDVYSYNTYIGNGNNKVRANITNDITFGGNLQVRNGSTLNVSDKDVIVRDRLTLDSGSTTNFKVYTTDISTDAEVANPNSGRIYTDYLTVGSDAKFNIIYDGTFYGTGTYNLIEVGGSGEDYYVGTEANGLVTDNSIIDSIIRKDGENLVLFADRTGGGSYDAGDLAIVKSEIGKDYSNGASHSLFSFAASAPSGEITNALFDIINEISFDDGDNEKKQTMQRLLAPTANNSAISASLSATNLGLGTIAGRIADVRGGAGASGNILAFNDGAMTGLSAGEETLDSSLWIKAMGSTATQDKVEQYDGYKSNTYGIVAGADKTLKNGLTVGFALAYADTSTKQKDLRSGDNSDTNTIQATAYASKEFGNLYVDGMLSYANHSTDAVRTANSGKLTSDVKADQLSAKIETGYRFVVGEATTLTPFASLEYSMLNQKGYTEKGTAYQNDALKVDSTKLNKGTVGLGTKLATNVKAGDMTLIPELTVGVYNSFGDDSTDIKAQFVGGGNKFVTPTQELNETMINIGAGVKMSLSDTSSLILDVDHDRSSNGDFEGYSGSVSYRLNF